ncbi:MAG: hypothetical protein QE570_18490 [Verrucomicrobiota bacterium]|nr:hypothetical protein [Verrucomicrobiota bacterium]
MLLVLDYAQERGPGFFGQVKEALRLLLTFHQLGLLTVQLEPRHDVATQGAQGRNLRGFQFAWAVVEHTQGAECMPVPRNQWGTRVKADVRRASDQEIVGKAMVKL